MAGKRHQAPAGGSHVHRGLHSREGIRPPTVREGSAKRPRALLPFHVHVHLKALEEKGLIKRDPLKSRSIALTYPLEGMAAPGIPSAVQNSFSKLITVPLVGNVAAGTPILAEENITDTITLPTDIVGDSASFMLHVRGDSMINIGINDGDFVAVKQQPTANNGDIVVAMVEDGATVKRFFKENGYIRLQPENSSMEPIIVTENVSIVGKVTAVFRRL